MVGAGGQIRVGFTGDIFEYQAKGGIGRYFSELIAELHHRTDCDVSIDAWIHCCTYLEEKNKAMHFKNAPKYVPKFSSAGKVLPWLNRVGRLARKPQVDVCHWTYYPKGQVDWSRPNVVTFYDMIHEKIANKVKLMPIKRQCAQKATRLIAISECTKRDMVEMLSIPPERVTVVPLASDLHHRFSTMLLDETWKGIEQRWGLQRGKYILWVGARNGYKNFRGLISALSHSRYRKEFDSIVCVGGERLNPSDLEAYRKGLSSEFPIHFLAADDLSLAALYSQAFCFVCLSLYEGFGIPPLEAMGFGCPVVCANRSSLPEVVGDGGLLIDPESPDCIANALDSLWESESSRVELRRAGFQQSSRFSWRRCAEESLAVYRSAIEK
ncbi:glycosyltransferase family 4 protein [Pirellulaceae bacterium SH501]